MDYQVLARKWRPQTFADVVGQTHITQTLQSELIQNKTAHAYLFVGPRGIGKTTIARIFAKAMNCKNAPVKEPCCQCESCIAIADGNSLDLIEIDGASNNSVEDIRQLREEVLYSPTSSRYKIYIIDEVHMLSNSAWNALLKTIEEPPPHAKFLFATTEAHKVLPTVVSRCQRFDLQRITFKLITQQLKKIASAENVNISDSAIEVIARAADGGMRDAQSLLDQMIAFSSADQGEISEEQALAIFGLTGIAEMERLITAILRNDRPSLIASVYQLAVQGKNLEKLFEDILSFLRGIQICMIMQEPEKILETGDDLIALYRKVGSASNPVMIQKLLEALSPVGRMLHDAMNKQVFLETILLKAMRISHAVEIETLIERLNQIRKGDELVDLEKIPSVSPKPADSTVAPVTPKKEQVPAPVTPNIPPVPEIPPSKPTEKKTEPALSQVKTEPVPPVQSTPEILPQTQSVENKTEPLNSSQLPPVIPPPSPLPEKDAKEAPAADKPNPFANKPVSIFPEKKEDIQSVQNQSSTPKESLLKEEKEPVLNQDQKVENVDFFGPSNEPSAPANKELKQTDKVPDMPPAFPEPPEETIPEQSQSEQLQAKHVLENPKDSQAKAKPKSPEAIWHAAIEDMEHCKQPLLKAYMQEGRPESYMNGELSIIYDEESESMHISELKKEKSLVETCIRRATGNNQAVLNIMEKKGISSPHETAHQNMRDLEEVKKRAENNPFVKDVMDLFDASIIDVRG